MTTAAKRLEQFKAGTGVYSTDSRRARDARLLNARAKLHAAHDIADVLAQMGRGKAAHAAWCKFVARQLRTALGERPEELSDG